METSGAIFVAIATNVIRSRVLRNFEVKRAEVKEGPAQLRR